MMSKVLLFISVFYSCLLTAQQQHFDLEWNDEVIHGYEGSYQRIPGFAPDFTNYNLSKGLFFVQQWDESREINPRSAKITNIVYKTIAKEYLKDLNSNTIPEKVHFVVRTTTERGVNAGFIQISPIIKEKGVFKKIVSFDLNYTTMGSYGAKRSFGTNLALTNSVLASGDWRRFIVPKTGVYRITANFLSDLGFNLNGVDPKTIKIYGHGGKSLPLSNELNTDFDLPEIAIQINDGGDGSFSGDDSILFYGESTLGYVRENDSHINPYATTSYYYVTIGGSVGKRIQTQTETSESATEQITSYKSVLFEEKDLVTLSKSGRRWFGDKFDIELERSYAFDFPEIVPNSDLNVRVKASAKGFTPSEMEVAVNGESIGTINFVSVQFPNVSSDSGVEKSVTTTTNTNVVVVRYNQQGNPDNEGYLDYIRVEGTVPLKGYGKQFNFSQKASIGGGVGGYTLSNATNVGAVWDVTDPKAVKVVASNSGSSTLTFKAPMDTAKKYLIVEVTDFYQPEIPENSRVANQNLKGTIFKNSTGDFEDLDYLIVTNNELLSAANRLANFHRTNSNLNTKVVPLELIYNEFSSGKLDVGAIRNFVRYVYENASVPEKRLKYLCLFGDTSVDYRNNRLDVNNNIVPVFESLESSDLRGSFMTDDFYATLDPNEGILASSDKLDLAVGRILVDAPDNANVAVDKIIEYNNRSSYGSWRNRHLYVSDDVDELWETSIQFNLDLIANKIDTLLLTSNVEKIHMDAFKQETIAGGARYPEANAAMLDAIESGSLVVNYFGHGGEEGLATEFVITKEDARNLENKGKYPLFITVTCNFTKFDNPERITAGEVMYANPNGGAVSMITTTRQIGVPQGIQFNDRLPNYLFPENEVYTSIAQALVRTKNSVFNSDSRVVFFIGDPAMKLSVPKRQIRLTKINDVPVGSGDVSALEALSKVKLSGEVVKGGAIDVKYNGVLSTVVFDKQGERTTLANDGIRDEFGVIQKLTFKELGGVIFKGKASVKNGLFSFEFVVPRDIKIPVGTGRVSFYAENSVIDEDQAGRDDTILIGGINENAPEDTKGPEIALFLNDENFVSGGIVNSSPVLIAKFQDENGINTSSGIGHDIIAIIDGDETNPIVLNDFYETNLDDFTAGSLNFKLRDLEPGTHTLSVRVWDVYNNSSTQEIEFVVLAEEEFAIENVLNYPNPLINYTEFWFSHNNPVSAILDVQVQVFTVSGKVIWTHNQSLSGKRTYRDDITWDGRDNFGDRVGKGVYVYKISVKSTLTNKTVEKIEKLVIL